MMFHIFLLLAICASALGEECQTRGDKGASYRGSVSMTTTGKTCQAWDEQFPHTHSQSSDTLTSNFCRNPDGEEGVWCYTTDPKTRWEYCGVPVKDSCDTSSKCGDELCKRLRKEHHLVVMARVGYHCPYQPSQGEETECGQELLKGMDKCEEFDDCLIDLISETPACNGTSSACRALSSVEEYASMARYSLCQPTDVLTRDGGACSWWDTLEETPAILAAASACVAQHGVAKASRCVLKILGSMTSRGCICSIIGDILPLALFPPCASPHRPGFGSFAANLAKPASPGSGLGLGLLSTSALSGPLGPEGAILKRDLMTSLKTMQTHNPANHEQEWYTDGAVTRGSNGEIIIKAEKQNGRITSGKVWTKDVWSTSSDSSVKNHGYVEVRATLPAKVGGGELEGSWPAIWLLGNGPSWPAEGEIDIVEMVNGEPKVYMTTHSPNHHGSYGQHPSGGSPLNCNANFVENELIAGLEWNLHGSQIDLTWWITFFDLSSQSWKSASPNTLVIHKDGGQDYWNFYNTFQNKGFYLIVNLAEGGDWPSDRTFVDGKPQYIHISSAKVYGFKTEK